MEKITFCFILILSVCLANDINLYIYDFKDYYVKKGNVIKTTPTFLFTFGFSGSDELQMDILFKNEEPNMDTSVYVKYPSGNKMEKKKSGKYLEEEKYYHTIRHKLSSSNVSIEIELNTATGLCTRKVIAEGKYGTKSTRKCLNYNKCLMEVDLKNIECDELSIGTTTEKEPTTHRNEITETTAAPNITKLSIGTTTEKEPTTLRNEITEATAAPNIAENIDPSSLLITILTYVVPSVIVMCIIILMIYISVKKFCNRNSPAADTIELNTYSTAKEVIYADLAHVHEDSRPQKQNEESPYAQIIGVLKPILK